MVAGTQPFPERARADQFHPPSSPAGAAPRAQLARWVAEIPIEINGFGWFAKFHAKQGVHVNRRFCEVSQFVRTVRPDGDPTRS
jgi:hypothetical protein